MIKESYKKFIIPLFFPVSLWLIHLVSYFFDYYPYNLGIYPRSFFGLIGIVTAPLIHGSFSHLLSNTSSLIVLGFGVFYFYPRVAYKVFLFIYLATGILVWIFAREVYHIGASGVIYGFVSFLFFSGIFRRDNRSISLSLLVVFLYGGMIWGVFPGMEGISWESHLLGGVAGLIAAFIFRKVDLVKQYDWEDEESDIPPNKLEISYDPEKNKF